MRFIIYKKERPKDTTYRDWNFKQIGEIELTRREMDRLALNEYLLRNNKKLEEGMIADSSKSS